MWPFDIQFLWLLKCIFVFKIYGTFNFLHPLLLLLLALGINLRIIFRIMLFYAKTVQNIMNIFNLQKWFLGPLIFQFKRLLKNFRNFLFFLNKIKKIIMIPHLPINLITFTLFASVVIYIIIIPVPAHHIFRNWLIFWWYFQIFFFYVFAIPLLKSFAVKKIIILGMVIVVFENLKFDTVWTDFWSRVCFIFVKKIYITCFWGFALYLPLNFPNLIFLSSIHKCKFLL